MIKAAAFYNVSYSTLMAHVRKHVVSLSLQKYSNQQLIKDAYEDALVDWCRELFAWEYSMNYDLLRQMAEHLASIQKIGA